MRMKPTWIKVTVTWSFSTISLTVSVTTWIDEATVDNTVAVCTAWSSVEVTTTSWQHDAGVPMSVQRAVPEKSTERRTAEENAEVEEQAEAVSRVAEAEDNRGEDTEDMDEFARGAEMPGAVTKTAREQTQTRARKLEKRTIVEVCTGEEQQRTVTTQSVFVNRHRRTGRET